jgi:hypothetical protein
MYFIVSVSLPYLFWWRSTNGLSVICTAKLFALEIIIYPSRFILRVRPVESRSSPGGRQQLDGLLQDSSVSTGSSISGSAAARFDMVKRRS